MNTENLTPFNAEEVKNMIDVIISSDIPIRRMKKDGSFSFVPPEEFNHYLKDQNITFYLDENILNTIKNSKAVCNSLVNPRNNSVPDSITEQGSAHDIKHDKELTGRLNNVKNMNILERTGELNRYNVKLKEYSNNNLTYDEKGLEDTEKIFSDTFCINKVTFEENILQNHSPELNKNIVIETYKLISNLTVLLDNGKINFVKLAQFDKMNSGSSTLDHINRMLIRMISFLFYYNQYFQKQSTQIKKMRAYFQQKFRPHYEKLTKGAQNLSLELIFKDGIAPVRKHSTFIDYCIGGFMHDIGKLPSVDYFNSDKEYNQRIVRGHVTNGFDLLVKSGQFSWGAISCALLHHEYYGASYGYRQTELFQNVFANVNNIHKKNQTKYFISYNISDVGLNNTFAYFPNKVIEILDIYDAMTDVTRYYRGKALSPGEAVAEMKKNFISDKELGIDPILFNIFIDFLHDSGLIIDPEEIAFFKI